MLAFDASSMIYAWDNYPVHQFPGLWDWMASVIASKTLVMPKIAYKEVNDKTPECGEWLKLHNIGLLDSPESILLDAMRIAHLLGIKDENYHAKGVGENDLLIIATARAYQAVLVTEEERQAVAPKIPAKRKIPSVCGMPEVTVQCINFVEFIKSSDAVFR